MLVWAQNKLLCAHYFLYVCLLFLFKCNNYVLWNL